MIGSNVLQLLPNTLFWKFKHFSPLFQSKYDEKPEPGDLIEIFRGSYQHWAVYIGDGFVVHLAPPCESLHPHIHTHCLDSFPQIPSLKTKSSLSERPHADSVMWVFRTEHNVNYLLGYGPLKTQTLAIFSM